MATEAVKEQPGGELATNAQSVFAGNGMPDVDSVDYSELVVYGRAIEHGSKWRLGDIASAIARSAKYGEAKLEKYAADVGVEYSTLRDYKLVAERYPLGIVERSTHPWSVYYVLAAARDRQELVARKKRWTVAEARQLVRQRDSEAWKAREARQADAREASRQLEAGQLDASNLDDRQAAQLEEHVRLDTEGMELSKPYRAEAYRAAWAAQTLDPARPTQQRRSVAQEAAQRSRARTPEEIAQEKAEDQAQEAARDALAAEWKDRLDDAAQQLDQTVKHIEKVFGDAPGPVRDELSDRCDDQADVLYRLIRHW